MAKQAARQHTPQFANVQITKTGSELPVLVSAFFIPTRKRGPKRIDRILNEAIERHLDAVEKIIAYLDQRDGDLDLEEGIDDLPHDEEPDLEDGGDDEPELAAGTHDWSRQEPVESWYSPVRR